MQEDLYSDHDDLVLIGWRGPHKRPACNGTAEWCARLRGEGNDPHSTTSMATRLYSGNKVHLAAHQDAFWASPQARSKTCLFPPRGCSKAADPGRGM